MLPFWAIVHGISKLLSSLSINDGPKNALLSVSDTALIFLFDFQNFTTLECHDDGRWS